MDHGDTLCGCGVGSLGSVDIGRQEIMGRGWARRGWGNAWIYYEGMVDMGFTGFCWVTAVMCVALGSGLFAYKALLIDLQLNFNLSVSLLSSRSLSIV